MKPVAELTDVGLWRLLKHYHYCGVAFSARGHEIAQEVARRGIVGPCGRNGVRRARST